MTALSTHPLIDKLPPCNLEAEQGVLGSVLLDNEMLPDVVEVLSPADFYRDSHQTIYREIVAMHDLAQPIDCLTLAEHLERKSLYVGLGGNEFLATILHSVPHALNARYYADIVRQKSISRRLIEAANQILSEGYSNNFTAEQLTESAERLILAISDSAVSGSGPRLISEFGAEAIHRIACRREQDFDLDGVATGFSDLDFTTGGLGKSKLIVLAARPGMGKSALGLQIAEKVVARGGKALFISLEMSGIDLAERALVSNSMVSGTTVRAGRLNDREFSALVDSYEATAREGRLWLDEDESLTLARIKAAARRHKIRHGLDLLVLDYLQLVNTNDDPKTRESRQEQVSAMSRGLHGLAKQLAIPVLCLAQLNRESEKRGDKRPQLSDLRESGAIEQDSDQVWLLHRPEYYNPEDRPGEAQVIVAKNRNGATGQVPLTFTKELARFDNRASQF